MKIKQLLSKLGLRKKGLFNYNSSNKLSDPDYKWGNSEFLKASEISLYVNKGLTKRAEEVGSIEFEVLDKNGTVIEQDDILDVLYRPNEHFSKTQFFSLYQKYYDIFGSAYIWIEQGGGAENVDELFTGKKIKIKGLHLLRPDLVNPIYNNGEIKEYHFHSLSGEIIKYPEDEIIRDWRPDPASQLNGESLLRSGIRTIDTENQIDTYHSKILRNGGKIEGLFKFSSNTLTADQVKENKDAYKKQYAEARNSGMPLFLGGSVDYQRLGLTPDELSFLDAKKINIDDLSVLTQVPKVLLGNYDGIKFDNAESSIRYFLAEVIDPLMRSLVDKLNSKFYYNTDRELSYVNPVPEDKEDKRKDLETANLINAMTINEKRAEIGLDPIKNGDEVYIPFNLVPIGTEKTVPESNDQKKKSCCTH